jgi:hypothetical protein
MTHSIYKGVKALIVACAAIVSAVSLQAQITMVWNPLGNPTQPSDGLWTTAANWVNSTNTNSHAVPVTQYKADFNSAGASVPCVINSTVGGCQVVLGDTSASGTLIVTNGGNLSAGDLTVNPGTEGWTAVGYSADATMIIEPGATVTFNYHLLIGFSGGATGTFIMNGGTASVAAAFALGSTNSTGIAHINGGTLTLSQWATNSIQGSNSLLDLSGGTVVITGNAVPSVDGFIAGKQITGYGGAGMVNVAYNGSTTTLTATAPAVNTPATLSIQLATPNLTVFWPTSSIYYDLQSATNLAATPIIWQLITNSIIPSNGNNVVILPLPAGPTYYSLGQGVDPSTMDNKLLMGYQGWFGCPGDGSVPDQWWHWFHNQTPTAANANIDFLPDVSELTPGELFNTQMTYSNGAAVPLYSAAVRQTVVRHFQWMQENQLDGVFLQRFLTDVADPRFFSFRNQVTTNVQAGAETYGRVFAIMYDVSGEATNSLISNLTNDWAYMVNTLHVTSSPRYLHHKGKPVVAIWGFGFNDGNHLASPQQAQVLINWFKAQGLTVMGGVPTYWRTLTGDSYTNSTWTPVYLSFDVISPWAVGRYSDNSGADNYAATVTAPDLAECTTNGNDYVPVVFPGFSWHNENGGTTNQIPRNGGSFYWRQVYDSIHVGCNMIYGAMFDECDEGTAMYKLAPTPAQLPAQGEFVALNVDGYNLPSDWYLQLANQAAQMLRGQIPLQSTMPITPP